jgi:homoserine kinase
MENLSAIKVFAPATIGNVSVGFDALGVAVSPLDGSLLGDIVELQSGELQDWTLETSGDFASELPEDPEDNIAMACCRRFAKAVSDRGTEVAPLKVGLEKRLPIGTGLGSSACSVVATLEALNRLHRYPLGTRELFSLMAQMEGSISGEIHTDNIGPCLFGGLRLCPPGAPLAYALPWPAAWKIVVCWPGTRLDTRESRAVLPAEVPVKTSVKQSVAFASFIHALHTGDTGRAAGSMTDFIAEPHRSRLLPGFVEAKAALSEIGALAIGIAGSGPSIFAIADDPEICSAVQKWMASHYCSNDRGFALVCRAELGGARSIS